ncbi:hypothetical protein DENSPDRAFT_854324 [Dentipellis sp. KUC8613]|nr:hypothetical protein DENSPDRAFT_854324 [Dentipellis sp. KUC8613]
MALKPTADNTKCPEINDTFPPLPVPPQVTVDQGKPTTWWEEWDIHEAARKKDYDPNLSRVDRLIQASSDFHNWKLWPKQSTGHRLNTAWDSFRTYIGLLYNPNSTPKKRALIEAKTDEQPQNQGEEKDIRMDNFLNNPELCMCIFFSSYFRDKGFIWSEHRCLETPKLALYFLRYLERNHVFPEPSYEGSLRRASQIADRAQIELPLTHAISKAVTDNFHDACQECWGTRRQPFDWGSLESQRDNDEGKDKPEGIRGDRKIDVAEQVTKRQKTNVGSAPFDAVAASVVTNATSQPILLNQNTVPESVSAGGWGNPGSRSWGNPSTWGADSTWGNPSAWGADNTWGNPSAWGADNPWGNPSAWGPDESTDGALAARTSGSGWGDAGNATMPVVWDDDDDDDDVGNETAPWARPPPTLIGLLGPTALPLTHEPGVVEWSMRRIVSLHPPLPPRVPGSGPDAVEEALERSFGRVVFAPWLGWDKSEKSDIWKPVIPTTSKGAVVTEDAGCAMEVKGGGRPHNPLKDEITVLVMPEIVDLLSVGMGLGAHWIELARQDGVPSGDLKGKRKGCPRYWYIEQVTHVLPSYYIE